MIGRLEHTAIASPDPEKLARWYVEHLDFEVVFRYDSNVFIKAPGGGYIEIIKSEGPRIEQGMKAPGIRHLALEVDDFEQAIETLKAKGVKFIGEPQDIQGNKLVFFQDLEGNLLHLVQRQQPLP